MTGIEIVQEIVGILGAGISGMGQAVGAGVNSFVQSLAFVTTGEGSSATTSMSIYFIVILALAGVALAIALCTRIFTWLTTLGN